LSGVFSYIFDKLSDLFLSSGSLFSLTSLISALCLAVCFLILRRFRRNKRIRIKAIMRALFPRRITSSPSHFADIGYFFFNVFVYGLIFGWAVLSFRFVSNVVIDFLVATFGAVRPTTLPDLVSRSVITVAVFLAYELGYWIDHYLSHRVPILWEFHKVHHTANVLTPLTAWRVHPLDTLKFYNILAITTAIANGSANYMFGKTVYQYSITDTNLILVLFIHAYVHLQHTELWISFRGVLGCIFLSPAHHQVHHSSNPVHFDKNLGSCLAVWDWLFGTLYVPAKEPEKLSFGVEADDRDVHTVAGGLLTPIYRAGSHVRQMFPKAISAPDPTSKQMGAQ
jgi:sterol desaturase/sphingolipid hydroxylase (fatty acid hydroxylase superfamily)